MKFKVASLLILPLLALSQPQKTHWHEFAPENDLQIPVTHNFSGITEQEFNDVLDKVSKVYAPIFTERSAELNIERKWDDPTVNAYAYRSQNVWTIAMFGGLARHKEVTYDAFTLVACHELGHHVGGFPRNGWASNEGNSDYYATLKCARKVWADENSVEKVKSVEIDEAAAKACDQQWSNAEAAAVCKRSSMAGKALARLLADLGQQKMPEFETPDKSKVKRTDHSHPRAQCRLDTYFAGALCTVDHKTDMDEKDPNKGACPAGTVGGRPACWYIDPTSDEETPAPSPDDEFSVRS